MDQSVYNINFTSYTNDVNMRDTFRRIIFLRSMYIIQDNLLKKWAEKS